MSDVPAIIDLHKVIEPYLDGGTIVSYTSRYLTKPGDNYGSIMLSMAVIVKMPGGQTIEMPLIAKLPPITNDLYWQIFCPERTCISENAVYKYLSPALRKLQLEADISENELFDGFPRYFGSRISLDAAATVVDRDAVLVQDNLQKLGYKPGNRHQPYDLVHTELILRNLARFHALPIALRLKKPEWYNEYVRPYFAKFNMNETMSAEAKNQLNEETIKDVELVTNNNEKEVERVKELLQLYDAHHSSPEVKDGPYNTIAHNDMWINNLMIKYDADGVPQKVKIVDFQIAEYESLGHDIVFFLYSSVDTELLEANYDRLFGVYYKEFSDFLTRLGVSTVAYSYEGFLKEVQRVAHLEIPHAIFMTKVVMADNSTLPEDFKDVDLKVLTANTGSRKITQKIGEIIRLAQKFKIFY